MKWQAQRPVGETLPASHCSEHCCLPFIGNIGNVPATGSRRVFLVAAAGKCRDTADREGISAICFRYNWKVNKGYHCFIPSRFQLCAHLPQLPVHRNKLELPGAI